MHRALIVARMRPDAGPDIAGIFTESDNGDLPGLVGVRSRSLFQFGDVYLHLVETEEPTGPAVARVAEHPEFTAISTRLEPYVSAYDPKTWRSPKDAMAHEFYRWQRTPERL